VLSNFEFKIIQGGLDWTLLLMS